MDTSGSSFTHVAEEGMQHLRVRNLTLLQQIKSVNVRQCLGGTLTLTMKELYGPSKCV